MFNFIILSIIAFFVYLMLKPTEREKFKENFVGPAKPDLRHFSELRHRQRIKEGYFTWAYSDRHQTNVKLSGILYSEGYFDDDLTLLSEEQIINQNLELPIYMKQTIPIDLSRVTLF